MVTSSTGGNINMRICRPGSSPSLAIWLPITLDPGGSLATGLFACLMVSIKRI